MFSFHDNPTKLQCICKKQAQKYYTFSRSFFDSIFIPLRGSAIYFCEYFSQKHIGVKRMNLNFHSFPDIFQTFYPVKYFFRPGFCIFHCNMPYPVICIYTPHRICLHTFHNHSFRTLIYRIHDSRHQYQNNSYQESDAFKNSRPHTFIGFYFSISDI